MKRPVQVYPHLSGNGVFRQNRGTLRSITGDACGITFGWEYVEGPLSQLPLGVVVVAQTPHPKSKQENDFNLKSKRYQYTMQTAPNKQR